MNKTTRNQIILLILILAIAAFFRFYKLADIPPGLYPDVAINGNDAAAALETGDFRVFYPENNGREGLFINTIAISFAFFGISVWSIKIVAAIIGFFSVLGLYLMLKELFRGQKQNNSIALLSSFFLAASFWHILFSRIGFRAILVPFFLVWGFYFLFRGINMARVEENLQTDNQDRFFNAIRIMRIIGYWILTGLLFGLGFHTYISYRVAPAILGMAFLIEAYNFWRRRKILPPDRHSLVSFLWPWLFLSIVILIAASPMIVYFYNNPQDFMGRSAQVSVFNSATPIKDLTISKIKTLGMFNFWGDCNWRHNFACQPQLPYAIGILFLFGLFLCAGEIIKVIHKYIKKIAGQNQQISINWSFAQISFFLLTWFVVMLLPAVLTNEGLPHALRSIGVIPAVYIFIGIGAWWVYEKIKNYESKAKYAKKITSALLGLFFAWSIAYAYDLYFIRWGQNPEVRGAFTQNYVNIGNYLDSLPKNIKKYVVVNEGGVPVPFPDGIPMPAQTIMFITRGTPNITYLKPEQLQSITGKSIVVLIKYDENILNQLQEMFPRGKILDQNGIWSFEVNTNLSFKF